MPATLGWVSENEGNIQTLLAAANGRTDTLAFAGVAPGMVVGELFPGGGYYTRMLSDVVGPTGKVMPMPNTCLVRM